MNINIECENEFKDWNVDFDKVKNIAEKIFTYFLAQPEISDNCCLNGYNYKTVSFDLENWFWNGETRSCNIAIDEIHFQLNDNYHDYMSYEFFKTALYSPAVFFEFENENVTTATCPKTGKNCYKLSLTSNSCDSLFGGSCDINIYLDKTTNQLTYVERIDTSGSNRGTYSTSNFTYSK